MTAAGAAFATTSMEKISSAARYTSQATASGMNSLNEKYHVVDKARSAKEATASFFTKIGANIKERSNTLFNNRKDSVPDDAAAANAATAAADSAAVEQQTVSLGGAESVGADVASASAGLRLGTALASSTSTYCTSTPAPIEMFSESLYAALG